MLCSNYPPHPGGLEIMVQNLARGLARRHEVTVVTSAFAGAEGTGEEDGMIVHRIPTFHATERLGIPYPVPSVRGFGAALRSMPSIDLLHAHGALYASSIHAAQAARRLRVPLVLTEHVGFVEYGSRAINAVESIAWGTVGDRVVGGSRAVTTYNSRVMEWLTGRYPGHDIHFIGNGVDTATFHPRPRAARHEIRRSFGLPDDRPLVLFAARASEKKNLDAVLAFPREAFHLVVCGAPRGLRADGLTDLGVVPYGRMPQLFGCVDAMVHASTGEGFPLAVQEALASGLALALLWDPGYGAWLDRNAVAACDDIGQLDQAVRSLATDQTHRGRLSAAGREWALQHWSWDATVQGYEQLYLGVTQVGRRQPPTRMSA